MRLTKDRMLLPCSRVPGTHVIGSSFKKHLLAALREALVCLVLICAFAPPACSDDSPKVVIIDSYHHGYNWSDKEIEGFLTRMREVYTLLDPPLEHLDAKRHPGRDNAILMKEVLKQKYANRKIDLIAVLDNPALNLILESRQELFPGVPVVFGGINDFEPELISGHSSITGVAERMNLKKTIDIALQIHPQTKELLVVHDYTVTGLSVQKELQAIVPSFAGRVRINFLPPSTFQEAAQAIRSLPKDSLGLLVAFVTDRDGRSLPIDQSTELLTAESPVPIYGMHTNRLGHGIVGGELLDSSRHGRRIADLALRVLKGEKPETIPVETTIATRPMFDHKQLVRFGIPESALPPGSSVINRPESFFNRYRLLTIWTLTIVMVLLVLIAALATSLVRLLRTQKALGKSEADYRRIVETANEGVWSIDGECRTTFVNPRLAAMMGYSTDEMVGKKLDAFVYEPDLPAHQEQMALRRDGRASIYERRFVKKDGGAVWTRVSATPILADDGTFRGSFAMLTDNTDRMIMDNELRESEKLYRNLFEQAKRQEELQRSLLNCSADPIVVYDLEGRVQYLNPAHTHLFGWTLDEAQGTLLTALTDADRSATPAIRQDMLSNGATHQSYDTQRPTKDGRLVDVSVSGARYLDHEGRLAGTVVIIRDISDRKKVEESLKESEERFRLAFENANIGVCLVAPDGGLLRINDQFCQMLGYSRSQLEGMTMQDVTHPDDVPFSLRFARKACAGEIDRYEYEKRFIHKQGHVIESRVSSSLVTDGQRKPLYFISHVQNITERKLAEKALKESERRLATLMANLPGIAYRCINDPNWSMKFISEGCFPVTGYLPRDLIDNRNVAYGDLIHPDDRQRLWSEVQEAVASDRPFELEYRIKTQAGHEKWVWERGLAAPSGLPGHMELEGFISDVTERKHMEHALQESEQRYRAVIENLQIGICVLNPRMEIIAINPFFHKIFPEIQPGMKQICYEMYNDQEGSAPCPECPCVKTFEDGMVHEGAKETRVEDRVRSHRIVSCPIKDDHGRVEFVIELVEDVTETKALQLQLSQSQKLEAVGTLAGGVAHDFNNLLQVVLGYSELLLTDGRFPREYEDDLQRILQAARNGADLVARLLTFSRKSEYRPVSVNLNQRIEQLQKILSRTIPKMIAIEMVLAQDLALIHADPIQIDQILMNLALNSRDAMPDGGRLIIKTMNVTLDERYCKSHPKAKAGPHVMLSVSDTGQGMDAETQEHIFEPFYTTKETGKGTGLGLAMVYGIVQQHGGHITCQSEPSSGTDFNIYFPALAKKERNEEPEVGTVPHGTSELILLVDDEPLVRDLCSRILTKFGYRVITAEDGNMALEIYAAQENEVAVVILDLSMPGMGGKQCLEELLVLNPSVKVIIASGYSADSSASSTLQAGAKAFVSKPYNMRQVLQVVREVLNAS